MSLSSIASFFLILSSLGKRERGDSGHSDAHHDPPMPPPPHHVDPTAPYIPPATHAAHAATAAEAAASSTPQPNTSSTQPSQAAASAENAASRPSGAMAYRVATQSGPLSIRTGPGNTFKVIGTLAKGALVTSTGRILPGPGSSSGWAEINNPNGGTGWSAVDYLSTSISAEEGGAPRSHASRGVHGVDRSAQVPPWNWNVSNYGPNRPRRYYGARGAGNW